MTGNRQAQNGNSSACDSEALVLHNHGLESLGNVIPRQHALQSVSENRRNNSHSKASYLKRQQVSILKITVWGRAGSFGCKWKKSEKMTRISFLQLTHSYTHTQAHTHIIITSHRLPFLFKRKSWHVCTRFTHSHPGWAENRRKYPHCARRWGLWHPSSELLVGIFQQLWGAWKASPWSTSHFQFHRKRSRLGISTKCCYK